MSFREHVEHPPEFAVAFRYIEIQPPQEHPIKPLPPEGTTRYFLKPLPPLALILPDDTLPASVGFERGVEYLHKAALTVWQQSGPDRPDLEREEVVRFGWYTMYTSWFWSPYLTPPAEVPSEVMEELQAVASSSRGSEREERRRRW